MKINRENKTKANFTFFLLNERFVFCFFFYVNTRYSSQKIVLKENRMKMLINLWGKNQNKLWGNYSRESN